MEVMMNVDDEKVAKQKEAMLAYLMPNIGSHNRYAWTFIICELLNSVNVIVQIFVTDEFLNNSFSNYILQLFALSQKHPYQRSDQLARVLYCHCMSYCHRYC